MRTGWLPHGVPKAEGWGFLPRVWHEEDWVLGEGAGHSESLLLCEPSLAGQGGAAHLLGGLWCPARLGKG